VLSATSLSPYLPLSQPTVAMESRLAALRSAQLALSKYILDPGSFSSRKVCGIIETLAARV